MINSIIFDFDGVIADSNEIRNNTYFDIFSDIPDSKEIMLEAINEDSKRDRYGIIKATLEKMKGKKLISFKNIGIVTVKYVKLYNDITEKGVSEAREIPGANKALELLSKKYNLYIVTGTLQKSMDIVLKNRGLDKYFKKVYGSFRDKIDGMKKLLEEEKINPGDIIYIGDGNADYKCAKFFNIIFIGVVNETNDFEDNPEIKYKIFDLTKLSELIEEINKI